MGEADGDAVGVCIVTAGVAEGDAMGADKGFSVGAGAPLAIAGISDAEKYNEDSTLLIVFASRTGFKGSETSFGTLGGGACVKAL